MFNFVKELLDKLPFNGKKTSIGLVLGSLLQIVPNIVPFLPPQYAAIGAASIVLLGAIHKLLKK